MAHWSDPLNWKLFPSLPAEDCDENGTINTLAAPVYDSWTRGDERRKEETENKTKQKQKSIQISHISDGFSAGFRIEYVGMDHMIFLQIFISFHQIKLFITLSQLAVQPIHGWNVNKALFNLFVYKD